MKTTELVIVLAALLPALVTGQKLDLKMPESLGAKAREKTEISLDADTLAIGRGLVGSALPKDMASKFQSMKELHVYSYEFESKGQYSSSDLEPLRKQLRPGSGWSRIVNVQEKDESTEIHIFKHGDKVAGFLMIAAEAMELSIIHVVGDITMAQLQELVKSTIAYDLNSVKPAAQ